MAVDTTGLKKKGGLRPGQMDDAVAVFTDAPENEMEDAVDLIAAKASTKTAIQDLINATSLSTEDKTALYSAVAAALDAGIANTYSVNITDVASYIKEKLLEGIAADTSLPHPDLRCNGEGRYVANTDPSYPADDTSSVHCTSCDGLGRTSSPNTPVVSSWAIPETTY